MHRRTKDVFVSLLERAGYGLGYSEEEARLDEAQPRRRSTVHRPWFYTASQGERAVGRGQPSPRRPAWTGLGATSIARRLRVWNELEGDLVGSVEAAAPGGDDSSLPILDRRPASMQRRPSSADRPAARKVAAEPPDPALALEPLDESATRAPVREAAGD